MLCCFKRVVFPILPSPREKFADVRGIRDLRQSRGVTIALQHWRVNDKDTYEDFSLTVQAIPRPTVSTALSEPLTPDCAQSWAVNLSLRSETIGSTSRPICREFSVRAVSSKAVHLKSNEISSVESPFREFPLWEYQPSPRWLHISEYPPTMKCAFRQLSSPEYLAAIKTNYSPGKGYNAIKYSNLCCKTSLKHVIT